MQVRLYTHVLLTAVQLLQLLLSCCCAVCQLSLWHELWAASCSFSRCCCSRCCFCLCGPASFLLLRGGLSGGLHLHLHHHLFLFLLLLLPPILRAVTAPPRVVSWGRALHLAVALRCNASKQASCSSTSAGGRPGGAGACIPLII